VLRISSHSLPGPTHKLSRPAHHALSGYH
jgi:hypothetical protein